MTKLYVGNLNFATTEDDIKAFFAEVAEAGRVSLIRDKLTNQSRGFAFVEIEDGAAAQKAISTLNGRMLKERPVKVNEAKPMEPRNGGGGNRGGRF